MENYIKKIAIVTDAYIPQTNGVVTTILELEKVLKNRNYEVCIVSPLDTEKRFKVPFYPEIELAYSQKIVKEKLKRFKPDAIHIATEFFLGFSAYRFCVKNNIPYSTSYHTNWPEYVKSLVSIFPENLVYYYLKKIHCNSKRILVTNNDMKQKLLNKGFKNIVVWHRGVDKNIFNAKNRKDLGFKRPIFLNVGRVSIEKNLEDFLEMDLPGTKVLVGDGPLLEYYKRKYKDVVFLGKKVGKELAEIYASSDVFVFPSKTDTFGMVIIEALQCGLPVAAYNVIGPREIIEHGINGYLSKCGELRNAALKCLDLNRIDVLRSSEKWSIEKTADIFVENLVKIDSSLWNNI